MMQFIQTYYIFLIEALLFVFAGVAYIAARVVMDSKYRKEVISKEYYEATKYLEKSLREHEEKLAHIEGYLSQHIDKILSGYEAQENEIRRLKNDIESWAVVSSLDIPSANIELTRFITVQIYMSESSIQVERHVKSAIMKILFSIEFEISTEFTEKRGSWWQKWVARSKVAVTHPETMDRLKKIERAIEMRGLDAPQAEIDKLKSSAVAELIKSIENVPSAALQVGSILIVKTTLMDRSSIQTRTLSNEEMIQLENNQHLPYSPEDILKQLNVLCKLSIGSSGKNIIDL